MSAFRLPDGRLETDLDDHKALLSQAAARAEAERCLYCTDAPCVQACPTAIDVPTFIKKIASGNVRGSARTILEQNLLGWSCGRVCPVEELCVGACVYNAWGREPIAIGQLQRYATEIATGLGGEAPTAAAAGVLARSPARVRKKAACIGAGPASLAFAGTLALAGHEVVVFDKRTVPGGLNTTGIAPYKLHAHESLREVAFVQSLGVEIRTGIEVGATSGDGRISARELLDGHDALFLGVGLGADAKLGLPGEDGPGVYGATAWIEAMKVTMPRDARASIAGARVVVVGGGNTAIDVARECAELGAADVVMVYRRDERAMSGYAHELRAAREAGVRLETRTVPVAFVRDAGGTLTGVRVAKTDEAGKRLAGAGTEHEIPCTMVALAIGQSKLREIARELPGVELDARGCVVADTTGQTGHARVFAGGDCVNGGKEVVNAVAHGRDAARAILAAWARDVATQADAQERR